MAWDHRNAELVGLVERMRQSRRQITGSDSTRSDTFPHTSHTFLLALTFSNLPNFLELHPTSSDSLEPSEDGPQGSRGTPGGPPGNTGKQYKTVRLHDLFVNFNENMKIVENPKTPSGILGILVESK